MRLEISRDATIAIVAEAAFHTDREVCGLLLGRGRRIEHVVPCRNVSPDPAIAFEIDPAALVAAHRQAREGGPAVIGHYHSHPSGSSLPSRRDAEAAADDGAIWAIVAGGALSWWHAVRDGPIEGAFEPINCDLLPEGCTTVAPPPEEQRPVATNESILK
jgi:proteasome lid subunit RPN8/RPN11